MALSVFVNRKIRVMEEGGQLIVICPVQSREIFCLPAVDIQETETIAIAHLTPVGPEHYHGVL